MYSTKLQIYGAVESRIWLVDKLSNLYNYFQGNEQLKQF